MTDEREAKCAHNWIFITASSYRPAPYYFCSRCGGQKELPRDHHKEPSNG